MTERWIKDELGLKHEFDVMGNKVYYYDEGFFCQHRFGEDVWFYIDPSMETCENGIYSQSPISSVEVFTKLFL